MNDYILVSDSMLDEELFMNDFLVRGVACTDLAPQRILFRTEQLKHFFPSCISPF